MKRFFDGPLSFSHAWVERVMHPTHLETVVQWAVQEGYTAIAVWGGDGSFSRVVQALDLLDALEKISVLLIPVGTCNDFSRAWKLPSASHLYKSTHALSFDEIKVDVGFFKTEYTRRVFVNNAGFGRSKEALERKKSNPIKDIFSFQEKTLRLNWTVKGAQYFESRNAILGMIFNSPFFNKGMYFDQDVSAVDGLLKACFEPPSNFIILCLKFLRSRLGWSLLGKNTVSFDFDHLHIESDADLFPQVDGEPVEKVPVRSLEIGLLPKKLRFLVWR